MGIYLNPGNDSFWDTVRSKIYIDKTELIACTNELIHTEQKYLCVSRPRRFGKTIALKMLAAYYSCGCDSTKLFQGRKIENSKTFQEHLNKYDVIFLNMQQFFIRARGQNVTDYLEQVVIREIRQVYGDLFSHTETILATVLEQIYVKSNKRFILLIDEWDCVMREHQESEILQKQYLNFLRDLLKDQPYVALAYMTGILPVKKYGEHSALNMFTEYSMTDQDILEKYTGFTENEVKELCDTYHMDFAEINSWYDGYTFINFKHIYNPKSVVEAMRRHKLSNYWTSTEVYDALKVYINMNFDGLRNSIVQMLGGGRVKINMRSFRNDMRNFAVQDDVLTLLVHLGYLAYDSETKEAFIPNKEIIEEFENAMRVGGWSEIIRIIKASEKLLEDTLLCNENKVAEGLDWAHTEVASILTYNDENSLSCAVGLAYYSARKDYTLIRELPTGHGFADIVFLPLPHANKPALIVELKYDKSANTAIQQIKKRHYTQALEHYSGEILLVGINYNKQNVDKPHSCVIEKFKK